MIIRKIFSKLYYHLVLKNFRPEIVPYRDYKGKIIKNSRVSILTHVSNKKNVIIGENVFIGHFNYIDGHEKVEIEKGCQITNYVSIVTHSSHNAIRELKENYIRDLEISKTMVTGKISIGEYSYIGPHTLITQGTTIGKNCIVGAFSYVDGNFPDNSIIRGVPARIIGNTNDN